jgi:hypothetical protein
MKIPHSLATDSQIEAAAAAFWGVISAKFPEMTTGDSQICGEDHAAFALWSNNDLGDRTMGMLKLSLPSQVSHLRVTEAVDAGMAAAKTVLPGVVESNHARAFEELLNCALEVIHWNIPEPASGPGWFDVHVYASEQEWEAGKGAGEIHPNVEEFADAIGLAESEQFAGAYEVTVKAAGEHDDYEPGEVVHSRFDRSSQTPKFRP